MPAIKRNGNFQFMPLLNTSFHELSPFVCFVLFYFVLFRFEIICVFKKNKKKQKKIAIEFCEISQFKIKSIFNSHTQTMSD